MSHEIERTLHLSDNIFEILLLQVVPGKENSVINQLRKDLPSGALFYLGFGRYDVVVVLKRSKFSLVSTYQTGDYQDIADCFPVCGIQWVKEGLEPPSNKGKSAFFGLTMIKLNPHCEQCTDHGPVEVEMELASELMESLNNPVCCNLGNYECVCLVEADSLTALSTKVASIEKKLLEKGQSSLDITTIPAVNADLIGASGKFTLPLYENLAEQAEISVFLSLGVGISDGLLEYVNDNKAFEACKVKLIPTYGYHDAVLKCSGPLGNILNGTMLMREKHREFGINSTFTKIFQSDFGERISTGEEMFAQEEDMLSTKPFEYQSIREAVLHFGKLISTSKKDFLTSDLFRDHTKLLESALELTDKIKHAHNKKEMIEYRVKLAEYDSFVDCMRQSFSQRFAGLAPGNLLAHKSLSLEPHGAIQRAILAIEAIPLFILVRLTGEWAGFCSYGYSHKFYRSEGGIINTPDEFRVSPVMWWGVFHELGHEYYTQMPIEILADVEDIVDAMAKDVHMISASYGFRTRQSSYLDFYTGFCEEIFAELFGFFYGFHCNWNLYREKLWRYLAKEFSIDALHLARSILVKLALGPDHNLRSLKITADYVSKCLQEIETIVYNETKMRFGPQIKKTVSAIVMSFLDIADKYANWFADQIQLTQYNAVPIEEITKSLSKGIPYLTNNPLEIIFPLLEYHDEIRVPMRLACILSLYNAYWRIYHPTLIVSSSAFKANEPIPFKYTCDGEQINPPLKIERIPEVAKSLVVTMDKLDAAIEARNHWVVWDISTGSNGRLREIEEKTALGIEGENDFGTNSYTGPRSSSEAHRYCYKVYALDNELGLKVGSRKKDVKNAMRGHILAKGELLGTYERSRRLFELESSSER